MQAPFQRIAVLGTGLIGGSFAQAVRQRFAGVWLVGWDRPEVAARAVQRGVVDAAAVELAEACRQAELIYVALPVGELLRQLPAIATAAPAEALITDTASTKELVERMARRVVEPPRMFLGGHPVAGRERGGLEAADPSLFAGATYVLVGPDRQADERIERMCRLIEGLGARPVWLSAAEHDRWMAFLSHLPQFVVVALAEVVAAQVPEGVVELLAGPGLRDSLRLAGSPYPLWADVAASSPRLPEALDRMLATLEQVRARLGSPALAEDFAYAQRLYARLRRL